MSVRIAPLRYILKTHNLANNRFVLNWFSNCMFVFFVCVLLSKTDDCFFFLFYFFRSTQTMYEQQPKNIWCDVKHARNQWRNRWHQDWPVRFWQWEMYTFCQPLKVVPSSHAIMYRILFHGAGKEATQKIQPICQIDSTNAHTCECCGWISLSAGRPISIKFYFLFYYRFNRQTIRKEWNCIRPIFLGWPRLFSISVRPLRFVCLL